MSRHTLVEPMSDRESSQARRGGAIKWNTPTELPFTYRPRGSKSAYYDEPTVS